MDENYIKYLIFIVLVLCFFVFFMIFVLSKRKKQFKKNQKIEPIRCGNISVFMDMGNSITIIPYVKDKFGVGRALANPQIVKAPYSNEKVGQVIRYSLHLCKDGTPDSKNELASKLHFTSWKDYSEGKKNLSIHFQDGLGLVLNTTRRKPDGSYQFNKTGFDKVLNSDADDVELGEMVLNLLRYCRC